MVLTSQRLLAIFQVLKLATGLCPQLPETCENTLGQTWQVDRTSFFVEEEVLAQASPAGVLAILGMRRLSQRSSFAIEPGGTAV